jgi:hypothetical protein
MISNGNDIIKEVSDDFVRNCKPMKFLKYDMIICGYSIDHIKISYKKKDILDIDRILSTPDIFQDFYQQNISEITRSW